MAGIGCKEPLGEGPTDIAVIPRLTGSSEISEESALLGVEPPVGEGSHVIRVPSWKAASQAGGAKSQKMWGS